MDKRETGMLMRAGEVSEALGVARATAYALMASGELPIVRIGRSVRVPRAGLEEWIRRQTLRAVGERD